MGEELSVLKNFPLLRPFPPEAKNVPKKAKRGKIFLKFFFPSDEMGKN